MITTHLPELRRAAGFESQAAFAGEIGCHWRTIQDLERGISLPSLPTMQRICRVLGKTPEAIWPEGESQ